MRKFSQFRLTYCNQSTYACNVARLQIDNSQISKACFRENHTRNNQSAAGNKRSQCIGENMLPNNSAVFCPQRSCRQYVFLILIAIKLHTRAACHTYPASDNKCYKQNKNLTGFHHMILQQSNDNHRRHSSQNIGYTFHCQIGDILR